MQYHRALSAVDESLGRLLQWLEQNGLRENTVVMFMGDNGFMFGEHGLIDKRNAYEESMRVPLLAVGPGFPAGSSVTGMVANIDIAPTLLELAGGEPPAHFDGRSFLALSAGQDPVWRTELLYEYYWEFNYPSTPTTFALRSDDYKFIQYHGVWDTDELYDLKNDPLERVNLINEPAQLARIGKMRERLFTLLENRQGQHSVPYTKKFSQGARFRHRQRSQAAEFPEAWLRQGDEQDLRDFMRPDAERARAASRVTTRPNVLLLMVDDLRPELPAYGNKEISAPHISSLAQRGVVFENAYANVPVCGASRASMLTGLRPTTERFVTYYSRIDEDAPTAVTLHEYLASQGYHTESLGKILHHHDDAATGWSVKPWHPGMDLAKGEGTGFRDYQLEDNIQQFRQAAGEERNVGPAYERAEVPDTAYFDGKIAQRAEQRLDELASRGDPFFLAVGFVKPHLPFNAPEPYWALYDTVDEAQANPPGFPAGVPERARHNWGELRAYSEIPADPAPVPVDVGKKLIQGYRASVSYVDAQIGRVLDALERNGLQQNTLVLLMGDHGWSLGEHGLWAKHSTFDVATRTPLVVSAPWLGEGGRSNAGLVELVDVYPTVLDVLGLASLDQLQGESFAQRLIDPGKDGKSAVFIRWHDAAVIKTPVHALTEWQDEQGEVVERMLFDHKNDRAETRNLATEETWQATVESLHQQLQSQNYQSMDR